MELQYIGSNFLAHYYRPLMVDLSADDAAMFMDYVNERVGKVETPVELERNGIMLQRMLRGMRAHDFPIAPSFYTLDRLAVVREAFNKMGLDFGGLVDYLKFVLERRRPHDKSLRVIYLAGTQWTGLTSREAERESLLLIEAMQAVLGPESSFVSIRDAVFCLTEAVTTLSPTLLVEARLGDVIEHPNPESFPLPQWYVVLLARWKDYLRSHVKDGEGYLFPQENGRPLGSSHSWTRSVFFEEYKRLKSPDEKIPRGSRVVAAMSATCELLGEYERLPRLIFGDD